MKSNLIILFSLIFLTGWTTSVSGQCDYPPGQIDINSAGGSTSALYTTNYVLVDDTGDIIQVATDTFFTAVTEGSYTIYAINYKNLTAPTGDTLTTGTAWANVETWAGRAASCADFTDPGLSITVGDVVTIDTEPIAATACVGSTATFTVAASGAGLSYQWQDDSGGSMADISGATSASYTTGSLTSGDDGTQYQVVVTGTCGTETSTAVAVTVDDVVTIDTEPIAATACVGSTATFTVAASGAGLSYQWQDDSGGSMADISGATSASYTTGSLTSGDDGTQYQVVVTGTCGTETSTAVAVTVDDVVTIDTEPIAATACVGSTATFTVAASGAGLSYQWQDDSGGSMADISGATSASYTTGSLTSGDDGTQYQVVVTGTCGTETSTAVAVTVDDVVTIDTEPIAATACVGSTATFTVAASGAGLSYQWQDDSGGSMADISGATSASYTTGSLTSGDDGTQYQVVVTGTCGTETSTAVAVTVDDVVTIDTEPIAATACVGSTATFTVAASGAGLSYQWQDDSGGSMADISGATSASYTTGSLTSGDDGTQYQVVVTGTCGTETSTAVAVTVDDVVTIDTEPIAATACVGSTATFTVAASGAGLSYQWQDDSGGSMADISGATSASYTTGSLTSGDDGTQYQIVVTGTCGTETSTAVAVTVDDVVTIDTEPIAATACVGSTATFTVAASGAGLSYQWQDDSGGSMADISGATSASYTTGSLTSGDDGTQYQVVVTGTCGTETSTAVAVTVDDVVTIDTEPIAATACVGSTATFTVAASGAGLSYQWQDDSGGSMADISGATSASYTTGSLTSGDDGTQYQVVVTGTCGTETSTAVAVTVDDVVTIDTEPIAATACVGSTATFTVAASGAGLSYQWQDDSGGSMADISGATSASYTTGSLTSGDDGTQYQVVVTGTCGTETSTAVAVTVDDVVTIDTEPIAATACVGSTATFTVAASGAGLSYQWQDDSGGSMADISGATSASYTTGSLTSGDDGTQYQVVVTGTCGTETSTAVAVTVDDVVTIDTEPIAATACVGSTATFTVAASGAGLSYQWQDDSGGSMADISGATSASYTTGSLTSGDDGTQYQVVVTGTCGTETSTAVAVTVDDVVTIDTEPIAATACVGSTATFTVAASGAGLSYQWQDDSGGSMADISGATSASYTTGSLTSGDDGTQYQIVVTGTCGTETSTAVAVTVDDVVTIDTEPIAATACVGSTATFTVAASGAGLSYQWQDDSGGSMADISGATSASYTTGSLTSGDDGTQYQVVVTGTCGTETSTAVAVTVDDVVTIDTEPIAATACVGSTATFTVAASGAGLSYQWQDDSGGSMADISGATSASYTTGSLTSGDDGTQYQVVVTGTCGTETSTAVAVTVDDVVTIDTEPIAATACVGSTATFTVAASGAGLSYQWQDDSGGSMADISGATSASYTTGSLTSGDDGTQYQVVVTGTCGTETSTAVAVTVDDVVTIDTEPIAATACVGSTATFTVAASGAGLSYQWQDDSGGSMADISGATSASYTTGSLTSGDDGTQYQVVVTGTCGTETSTAVAVTVDDVVTIDTEPIAATACVGSTATFTVAASGAGLSYQWQDDSGGSMADISGATSASYTTGSLTSGDDGTQYQVVVTGTCGTETSTAVAVTVDDVVTIDTEPIAATACVGSTATFTVAASGAGLSYQWQDDSGGSMADISGATSASYTTGSLTSGDDGTQYQIVVTGTCGTETSTAVAVTVDDVVTIDTEPIAATACVGSTATFTVAASGAGLSYQWQDDSGGSMADISGATSASYTTGSLTSGDDGTQYQVVVTGTCGTETSTAVAVTVDDVVTIDTEPIAATACVGSTATFTVAASGAGLSYQWQDDSGGSMADISGATSASYTTGSLTSGDDGTQYQVVVTGTCGTETSTAVAVTVDDVVTIDTEPIAATACVGSTATFTVAASGAGLSYQWQDDSGGSMADISGATSASYTTGSLTSGDDGTQYQVVVTGTCGTETSTAVAVTVDDVVTIDTEPIAATACVGSTATFTVAASGAGLSYQWQDDSGGSMADISGATSASYTTGSLTSGDDGTQYQVVVTGTCGTETSTAVAVTVTAVPEITNPGPIAECDSYTLPPITGTNLSGSQAYYDDLQSGTPNVIAGPITTTTTVYIYDASGSCSDEESFVVTITDTPTADNPSDVDNCGDYTLPALSAGNSYYDATGGPGVGVTEYFAGGTISADITLFVYAANGSCVAENSFNITISSPVTAAAGGDQNVCGEDPVTLAATGSGTWTGGTGLFTPGLVFYDMGPGASFGPDIEMVWNDGTNTFTRSNFASGSDLADTMNVWDPTGAWTFDVGLGRLSTASSGTLFGDLICNNTALVFSKTFPLKSTGSSAGSTYTPDPSEAGSSVTLTWTVSGGACPDDSDTMVATFGATPVAEAGTSVSACDDLVTIDLTAYISGFSATNGTGTWSVAPADGTITGTTYTPSATARSGGLVTVTYTVTGVGDCSGETDIDTVDLELAVCCNADAPTITKTP